jgi:hypothetical protein
MGSDIIGEAYTDLSYHGVRLELKSEKQKALVLGDCE